MSQPFFQTFSANIELTWLRPKMPTCEAESCYQNVDRWWLFPALVTIHYPPAFFCFVLMWRSARAHYFHFLGQNQSTVAQRAKTTVAECFWRVAWGLVSLIGSCMDCIVNPLRPRWVDRTAIETLRRKHLNSHMKPADGDIWATTRSLQTETFEQLHEGIRWKHVNNHTEPSDGNIWTTTRSCRWKHLNNFDFVMPLNESLLVPSLDFPF